MCRRIRSPTGSDSPRTTQHSASLAWLPTSGELRLWLRTMNPIEMEPPQPAIPPRSSLTGVTAGTDAVAGDDSLLDFSPLLRGSCDYR